MPVTSSWSLGYGHRLDESHATSTRRRFSSKLVSSLSWGSCCLNAAAATLARRSSLTCTEQANFGPLPVCNSVNKNPRWNNPQDEVTVAFWSVPQSTWLNQLCSARTTPCSHKKVPLLWHCWLGHVTRKIVSEMTYNVSSGTLNLLYHTIPIFHCMSLAVNVSTWKDSSP